MNRKIKKFIKDGTKENKKRLLTVVMDIGYFKFILKGINEKKLREDLAKEQGKVKTTAKGQPPKFIGDMEKVNQLSAEISRLDNIKLKLKNLESLYTDLIKYVEFVGSLDSMSVKNEEVLQGLNKVNKLL